MMNIIKGSIWIVAFILGINLSFEMISQANTMENVVGFFLLVLTFLVSYKTKCFTSIKMKKKKKMTEEKVKKGKELLERHQQT